MQYSLKVTIYSSQLLKWIKHFCQDISKGATIRYPGGGARKNFEINEFLLKSGEINKFFLNSGEKNICTQAQCISSVTKNVKKIFWRCMNVKKNIFASLGCEINFSSPDLPSPPPSGYLMVAP